MAKSNKKSSRRVRPLRQAQDKQAHRKQAQDKTAENKSSKTSIIPLADRVLVKPYTEDELKGGKEGSYGIIIPDTVSKEKSAQGKVIAVGEGKYDDGVLVPMRVKAGDMVIFSKYGYDEVEHEGEELYLLKEDNILAIIK